MRLASPRMTHTETEVTAELIRELLREQHPEFAHLPVELGAKGWDNQLWRLGDELAVRLPWATQGGDGQLLAEHTWVPTLAPHFPLPVPVPQRLGEPSELFPRPWTVTTWVPGTPADRAPIENTGSGELLGTFLKALHRPAPDTAPSALCGRGGPLGNRDAGVRRQIASAVESGLIDDPEPVLAIWDDAVAAPGWDGPAQWLHGDLHPANVLTENGTLCGVVDFGELCTGDPACDLASVWILLPDEEEVARCYAAYGGVPDPATLRRARGWAVIRAAVGMLIGHAGDHGRPGGKSTWGPPARTSLERLLATANPPVQQES